MSEQGSQTTGGGDAVGGDAGETGAPSAGLDARVASLVTSVSALDERLARLERALDQGSSGRLSLLPGSAPAEDETALSGSERSSFPEGPTVSDTVGGVWLGRIGVLALFFGLAFLLKHVHDHELLGTWGRVGIAALAGGALVGWGQWERSRNLRTFGLCLDIAGIYVLFGSFYAAHALFEMLSKPATFGLLIVTVALAARLAQVHRSRVLVLVCVTCGFLALLLLWTGENRLHFLLASVLILNLGALSLVNRGWCRYASPLAFLGSLVALLTFTARHYEVSLTAPLLAWTAVLWAVFPASLLVHSLRGWVVGAVEMVWIAIGSLFFLVYATVLLSRHPDLQAVGGLAALFIAVIFLCLAVSAQRWVRKEGRPTRFLYYAALVVVTLAVPLQISGSWIVSVWAVQMALLLLLAGHFVRREETGLAAGLGWYCVVLGMSSGALMLALDLSGGLTRDSLLFSPETLAWLLLGLCLLPAIHTPPIRASASAWLYRMGLNAHILFLAAGEAGAWAARTFPEAGEGGSWAAGMAISVVGALHAAVLVGMGRRGENGRIHRVLGTWLFVLVTAKVLLVDMPSLGGLFRVLSFAAVGVVLVLASLLVARGHRQPRRGGSTEE